MNEVAKIDDNKQPEPPKKSERALMVEQLKNDFMRYAQQLSHITEEEAKDIWAGFIYEAKRNPDILKCEKKSIGIALSKCLQFNLVPGAKQECCLIPRKNKDSEEVNKLELNFEPMVFGIIKIAYDSGFVLRIDSEVVCDNDNFEYSQGSTPSLVFSKELRKPRGKEIACFAVFELNNGTKIIEVMTFEEVEAIRKKAKTQNVWGEHWSEQARKTVIKRGAKRIRRSSKLTNLISIDNALERPDYALDNKAKVKDAQKRLEAAPTTDVLTLGDALEQAVDVVIEVQDSDQVMA